MSRDENNIASCFGILVITAVGLVGGAVMNGWVLSILWSWFVIPVLHLQELSIPLAIGFSLVVGMLTKTPYSSTDKEKKTTNELIMQLLAIAFGTPLFTLLLGYIIKLFL